MEYNKTEIAFPCFKKMYESNVEQSVDADFTLPDYYPEVTKVLKSMTDVSILTSQCNDSGVSIGGQVVITLLYSGGDGQPNSFTHIVPFTKSVAVSDISDGFATVQPRVNYVNTKAIGPRKVEVHGSLTLNICVNGIEEHQLLTSATEEGLYTKSSSFTYACPMQTVSKSIFVEDDIAIPQSKPTIGKILRSSASAEIVECKCVSGKIVAKGDLDLQILYCPAEAGSPVLLNERRGFSQVFDCEPLSDEITFETMAHVDTLELHPKTSLDGEVRNIAFEAKIGIDVSPYCVVSNDIIVDAFSGKYTADITRSSMNYEEVGEILHENFVCNKTLDFSGGMLNSIMDMWCKTAVDFVSKDGTDILIKGTVTVNVLGTDSEDESVYFERPIEFEYRYTLDSAADSIRCRPEARVVAVNYTLDSDGTVSVSVELCIKGIVFTVKEFTAATEINIDKGSFISRDNDSAVILYFSENETVWDIARRYKTSPEIISNVNGISDYEEQCNKVLLIPNV